MPLNDRLNGVVFGEQTFCTFDQSLFLISLSYMSCFNRSILLLIHYSSGEGKLLKTYKLLLFLVLFVLLLSVYCKVHLNGFFSNDQVILRGRELSCRQVLWKETRPANLPEEELGLRSRSSSEEPPYRLFGEDTFCFRRMIFFIINDMIQRILLFSVPLESCFTFLCEQEMKHTLKTNLNSVRRETFCYQHNISGIFGIFAVFHVSILP